MQNDLLIIDREAESVVYLGYPLRLTKREFAVLKIIVDCKDGISSQDILAELSPKRDIKRGNVAVQVFNINKKAKMIGGRSIIVERRADGYMLTEEL